MNALVTGGIQTKFSRQFASGCMLAPRHKDGKITFEQYMEEKHPI
jgi:hypothetical protein